MRRDDGNTHRRFGDWALLNAEKTGRDFADRTVAGCVVFVTQRHFEASDSHDVTFLDAKRFCDAWGLDAVATTDHWGLRIVL
jgi:hypothetical protein